MLKSVLAWFCLMICLLPGLLHAAEPELLTAQTLYVPVYSNVFIGPKQQAYNLAVNLSVRNTDTRQPIIVTAIDYRSDNGRLVRAFVPRPIRIAALGSYRVFIPEADRLAGFGAKFIVRWRSAVPVNAPLVEGVMIGARSGQGISFVTRAQAISN